MSTSSIFGRIVTGMVADRVGSFNVMIIICMASSVLVLALWLSSRSDTSIVTFACLYGFSSGGFVSLAPALVTQISDAAEFGTRLGILFGISSIGVLIGSPNTGALVSEDGALIYLQLFCGVMLSFGTCLFIICRLLQIGISCEVI